MPTIPLYTPTSEPDASHQVTAPGGYEWWYFDAEDTTGRFQLVAIFLDGFVFHPGYLRRYAKYLARPTRVTPPLPGDYPCAYFVLYEDGKIAAQFMSQYPPASLASSAQVPDVTIGPNRFVRQTDGTLKLSLAGTPWKLTWQGPKLLTEQKLSAELSFQPTVAGGAIEKTFLSRALSGAEHHWVLADPLCKVTGTIRIDGLIDGGAGRVIEFVGKGYHDHNYGTAPIGPGLKRWVWGRAIAGERVYTFHFARARDRSLPDEVHLIRADGNGKADVSVQATRIDWSRRTAVGLAYPNRIEFPPSLVLSDPRVVDSSPFYMRLIYDALLDGTTQTTAFCEVAYPHRLRWPILGRMIEMSIHRPAL